MVPLNQRQRQLLFAILCHRESPGCIRATRLLLIRGFVKSINTERARFVIELSIRDNRGEQRPISMAVGCDEALRISSRDIDDMHLGRDLGVALVPFDSVVTMIRTKEIRRRLFIREAERLANLLADRMEDAEGWHGADRAEAARQELKLA